MNFNIKESWFKSKQTILAYIIFTSLKHLWFGFYPSDKKRSELMYALVHQMLQFLFGKAFGDTLW